ncbi:MAG: potassium-transporting ATPase subunit KdpC [Burkholderiales bacterium]|nr:potassium-transporting ATPase subunit KdpC [Burkholderiales bacterium]
MPNTSSARPAPQPAASAGQTQAQGQVPGPLPASDAAPLAGLLAPCLRGAVFVLLVTGLAYPLVTTGVAQALMPQQAQGSLLQVDGALRGSLLIGQSFTEPRYFHPRPSSTSAPDPQDPSRTVASPYNAGLSAGSNLGPTSQALAEAVAARVADYRRVNGLPPEARVPVDAVTASASGLDPHISPANARAQLARVAAARALAPAAVQALVDTHTEPRVLGLLGEPRVHVLRLNLALDGLAARP